MGLFRPYERTDKSERKRQSTVPAKAVATTTTADPGVPSEKVVVRRGEKKAPTPTRREAEAARMARLHPNQSPKEQRKAARQARFKSQQETWEKVERSPERTLLRDFVDTRWTVSEFLMPAMILIMAAMLAVSGMGEAGFVASTYIAFGLWFIFILAIINIWIMWRGYKQLLDERMPNANRKGLLMYMVNRSMMIRRFRRPGPRVKRGDPV